MKYKDKKKEWTTKAGSQNKTKTDRHVQETGETGKDFMATKITMTELKFLW